MTHVDRIRAYQGQASQAVLHRLRSLLRAHAHRHQAQDYPSKPIKFIVPTAPAGIGDMLARLFQQKLGESGNPATIVVENRAGGGGRHRHRRRRQGAARRLPRSWSAITPCWRCCRTCKRFPTTRSRSFAPVILGVTVPNILVVHPSVPAKSVQELIAYAKANPGKLTYASQGVGASGHIAAELFKLHAGIDIVHVPYKGAAPAAQDLAAGHVNMMFDVVSLALGPIQAGRVRPLGVTTKQRVAVLPDVPTMIEQGTPVEIGAWFGFLAPPARRRPPSPGSTAKPPRFSRRRTRSGRSSTRAPRCRSARRSRSRSSSRRNPTATATSSSARASSWNDSYPGGGTVPNRFCRNGIAPVISVSTPHSTAIMIIGRGVPSANTP